MNKNQIKFSVISVNYNGGNKIVESIKSIANQYYKNIEIIIVDNGSEDKSIENVEKLKIKNLKIYKNKKNLGFTAGSNYGVEKCSGKYFLILNNDAYLHSRNFIQHSVNVLENSKPDTIGIFPKVVYNWEKNVINTSYVEWHWRQMWYDDKNGKIDLDDINKEKKVFGAMFVAPIFKKNLWNKIGGFDNRFFTYGEDFDVSYRSNILGYNFLYCPNIKVTHDFRSSSKDDSNPLWAYFFFQRNYLYVIIKNYQIINLIKYFKHYSTYFFNSLKIGIKYKQFKLIRLHVRVICDLLINLPYLLKKRKEIQKNRKLPDSKIWSYGFALNYNPYFYNNKIVLSLNSIENEN